VVEKYPSGVFALKNSVSKAQKSWFLSLSHLFEGDFCSFGQIIPSAKANHCKPDTNWPWQIGQTPGPHSSPDLCIEPSNKKMLAH
jgi:hypothetical protein